MVESHRINIRITREGVRIIELTLNPSLRKRGTYTPSLFKSKIPPFDRLKEVSEVEPPKAGRRGQGMSSI
jgi:hypothetical protein